MNAAQDKFSIPPLAKRAGGLLVVVVATVVSWLATPTGDLRLPLKLLAPLAMAFLGVLAAWASWTYHLWKRDSKRERIKEAHRMGRRLCACSETGEIMTLHYATKHSIEVYCCPRCTRFNVTYPNGDVLIADDTEFNPPLPKKAHGAWLDQSRAQRSR
jgi:hypothetical protein